MPSFINGIFRLPAGALAYIIACIIEGQDIETSVKNSLNELAISVYCALKYQDNFKKALIAAVNHSGDSDSTGAISGNILGAYLGLSKIPSQWIEKVELKKVCGG